LKGIANISGKPRSTGPDQLRTWAAGDSNRIARLKAAQLRGGSHAWPPRSAINRMAGSLTTILF
jgi:hypothetical protein